MQMRKEGDVVRNFERELKANFNEILGVLSDESLISDGKGAVLWVNPGFEQVYGIRSEEALGMTVYELEAKGYFKPSIIAKALERREKVTMVQKTNRGSDILVTATPVYDEQRNIKMVVSYSHDITELKEIQRKYSNLQNQVEKYMTELHELRKGSCGEQDVIGQSLQMEKIIATINRIADLDANVLLLGESGVGKTMLAKVIHQKSQRASGPFIDINCAAIPENLLESELFGYEKGSFTGANVHGKVGLMELADGGTLLLDEISEIPLALQAKLLKAIQEKTLTRVGGTKPVKVDFRLIAATNRRLEEDAETGKFRKDLYYRLNVVNIKIPPLCERREDILPLVDYYTELFNTKYGLHKAWSPEAMEYLTNYSWPGNIRELANVIERVIVISGDSMIGAGDLPEEITNRRQSAGSSMLEEIESLSHAVENLERELIQQAYEKHRTTTGVAKALKISQPTAFRKVSKYIKKPKE